MARIEKPCQLFQIIWQHDTVPQDFKDASIIRLYKRKGNRQVCDNHRGISLLSIAGKIVARVLLDRLNAHLKQGLLPESQCGFRKERGTIDMVFAARQLQEKCQEQHTDLYSTYVDLTKAFDTVSREGLWRIMAKYGCLQKFMAIVRQLHGSMLARVQDNGETTAPFSVSNAVKQGCVLAPTLFSLIFSGWGHFEEFRPGFGFWHICHVDRHGDFSLEQLRLSLVNETNTKPNTGPRLACMQKNLT